MSLELKISEADQISISSAVFTGSLSLCEIGALLFWAGFETLIKENPEALKMQREGELAAATKLLKEKGVLSIALKGNELSIKIDLDKLQQ